MGHNSNFRNRFLFMLQGNPASVIVTFENLVLKDLEELEKSTKFPWKNMSKAEQCAMGSRSSDASIVIKVVDKDGTSDHKQEILRQLRDTTAYEPCLYDTANEIITEIKITLQEGLSLRCISNNEYKFLLNNNHRIPAFTPYP